MKKFYKKAEAGTAPGGFVVRLDGRTLKTPLQHALILQSQALAEALASEWNAQGDVIVPAAMPLTQLVNTMIDKATGPDRIAMNAEICRYAGSDLVCYFATHPADIVKRQKDVWLPLLEWLALEKGIRLETVSGIQYHKQSPDTLRAFEKIVQDADALVFTLMQAVLGVTGSVVIALAFAEGHINAAQTWEAACVDEIYQLEKWGEDALARKKLDSIRAELEVLEKFRNFMQG